MKVAERVLARAEITLMPAEQFDALIASLDVPDVLASLPGLGDSRAREHLAFVSAGREA